MNPYELIGQSLGWMALIILAGGLLWIGLYVALKWAQTKWERKYP